MISVKPVANFIFREFDIFFASSWRDWAASIIPGLLFSIRAARESGLPTIILLPRYIIFVVWITSFIYCFNLNNQIFDVAGDKIDKPDRPIPSGKITLRGAKLRSVFTTAIFFLPSIFCPQILPETIVWLLTIAFANLTTTGNHWFGKNTIAMATGAWSLFSGSWKIIMPATAQSTRYVYALTMWVGLSSHIQDLRDVKGEIAIPLQGVVIWHAQITRTASVFLGISHAFLAWRVLQAGRGSKYDHKTYMVSSVQRRSVGTAESDDSQFYLYLFCSVVICPVTEG